MPRAEQTEASKALQLSALAEALAVVRRTTEELCRPLSAEDCQLQAMADASPPKWHMAHTTWFFETFVLKPRAPGYAEFDPAFARLFNSYYETVGPFHPRPERGLLSRPGLETVRAYRRHVDAALAELLPRLEGHEAAAEVSRLVTLGMHHERQHQELLLTDTKYNFSVNPLRPAYQSEALPAGESAAPPAGWARFDGGIFAIGHDGRGFAFDNETPRHDVLLRPFALATRAVTNGEWLEFMTDGGYRRPELWLSDGWATVRAQNWQAPLYWEPLGGGWQTFTLAGMRPVDPAEPVCHVSFYEAAAFAAWAGARLPSEAEWESAAADQPVAGNLLASRRLHPAPAPAAPGLTQLFGDVWEWTASPYVPYPGYRPPSGPLGEYNGKFMCSQLVLRGGSCLSTADHVRASYRNFFPPPARWQCTGVRLARDL